MLNIIVVTLLTSSNFAREFHALSTEQGVPVLNEKGFPILLATTSASNFQSHTLPLEVCEIRDKIKIANSKQIFAILCEASKNNVKASAQVESFERAKALEKAKAESKTKTEAKTKVESKVEAKANAEGFDIDRAIAILLDSDFPKRHMRNAEKVQAHMKALPESARKELAQIFAGKPEGAKVSAVFVDAYKASLKAESVKVEVDSDLDDF